MTDGLDLPLRYRDQLEALLKKHVPDAEVWAYGSRVNGRSHEGSDLDIALRSPTLEPLDGGFYDLLEAIEKSNIPILVQMHDWARLPESFHKEIERDHVVLQDGVSTDGGGSQGEWREVPFTQLLEEPVRNGVYKKKEYHGRGVKIVNMGELFANPRLRDVDMRRVELSESEQRRFTIRAGDLLFARRSLVAEGAGKCTVVLETNEPTAFESSIIRARPDPARADSLFLYYYFNSPTGLHSLDTIRRQVAVAGITGTDLAQLPVEVPPLSEQRAIAHVLGTLDDKVELNRRMNDTLEQMARALFKAWFVDFEPVRAKMEGRWRRGESLPGLPADLYDLFPDRLVDSELGDIPEGWEVKALGDVIELLSGGTPKTSVTEYWDGDIPWYTPKDAPTLSDIFVLDTERNITQAGVENSSTRLLPSGTTIISARGTVGRLACLGRPMAMNQTCYGIRGANGFPDYFTYFSVRSVIDELQTRTHGTIFDTITRDTFKLIDTFLPPLHIAKEFENAVEPMMSQILNNLYSSRALAAQRDALLPRLVSGEVRL